ncbi:MAG TPA: TonB family protein [Sphingomonadaceae bacterium]|nr:TonB family protein [Sphingomonadaceae bacterium]
MGDLQKIAAAALFAAIPLQASWAADPGSEPDISPPAASVSRSQQPPPAVLQANNPGQNDRGKGRPPAPANSSRNWIGESDYLPFAARNGIEGTVSVKLKIDPEGFVAACAVIGSSGSALLDAYTCELLPERAHFTPALDYEGVPTVGYWSTRVAWKIPRRATGAQDIVAPRDMIVSYSFEVGEDGAVSGCRIELASQRTLLADVCPKAARFPAVRDENGQPVRKRVVVTLTTLITDPDE